MLTIPIVCLSVMVYFEARDQSFRGQIAVAQVALERVVSGRYPDNVCDVVKQGPLSGVGDECQFSFYCDGKSDTPRDQVAYRTATRAAWLAMAGIVPQMTHRASHYHAARVSPDWAWGETPTVVIGEHKFYRIGK